MKKLRTRNRKLSRLLVIFCRSGVSVEASEIFCLVWQLLGRFRGGEKKATNANCQSPLTYFVSLCRCRPGLQLK